MRGCPYHSSRSNRVKNKPREKWDRRISTLFSQERTPSGWDRGVPVPERTLAGHTAAKGAFGLFTASQVRDKDGGAVYNTQTISTSEASLWPWISLASFPIDYNTEGTAAQAKPLGQGQEGNLENLSLTGHSCPARLGCLNYSLKQKYTLLI